MIRLIKWLFALFFVFGILMGVLVANSIEQYAIVEQPANLTANELKRVREFIKQNNPAKIKQGQIASTQLNQQDLNLALTYLSQKLPGPVKRQFRTKVMLDKKQAYIQASIHLPDNPLGKFINITAKLVEVEKFESESIELESLNIGDLSLPSFIARPLASNIHVTLQKKLPEYQLIMQSVQDISFDKNRLAINYTWDPKTVETIKNQLSSRVISDELKRALLAQSDYLATLSYKLSKRPSLNELFRPMFNYAKQRSENSNPVTENQAVFIVTGAYMMRRNIPEILGEDNVSTVKHRRIYLKGRHDLTKHLVYSAAITCMADSKLAESIGLEKEIRDSKTGSGFSFADLAADHAGIELAKQAIASQKQAMSIQTIISESESESDYMPDVENLPEGLRQTEFRKDYASTESEAYKEMEQLIKKRIRILPVHSQI